MRSSSCHPHPSRKGQTIMLMVIMVITLIIVLSVRAQKMVEIEQTVVERSRLERSADNACQNVTQLARWLLEQDARFEEAEKKADSNYVAIDSPFDNWSRKGPEAPYVEREILVRWRLVDAHSRFNINSLLSGTDVNETARKRYTNFLENLKIKEPERLTNSLSDWIDGPPPADGQTGQSYDPNLFEANAKNAPLLTLSELQMIPGYTQEILWGGTDDVPIGLYSCLTVAPVGQLNANSAPAHTLMLSHENMTPSMALRIANGSSSSAYESLEAVNLAAGQPEDLPINSLFVVHSDFFFLEMEAEDSYGLKQKKRVLIRRQGNQTTVESVENIGLFTWDEEIDEKMNEAVEKLIESLKE